MFTYEAANVFAFRCTLFPFKIKYIVEQQSKTKHKIVKHHQLLERGRCERYTIQY